MHRTPSTILLAALAVVGCAGCGTRAALPTADTAFASRDPAELARQTRRFTADEAVLLTAVSDALQDCGYTLEHCEPACGVITASLQRETNPGRRPLSIFGPVQPAMYTERVTISLRRTNRAECRVQATWRRTYYLAATHAYSHQTESVEAARIQEVFTAISRRVAQPALPL